MAGIALLVNIMAPLTTGKGNKTQFLNMDHLIERLGLFLLMVMGEAVLVVALANSVAGDFTIAQLVIVMSGLTLMIALWWLYFPYIEDHVPGKRASSLLIMIHAHGFLFGSLILIAAGLKHITTIPEAAALDAWIFISGVVLMVTTFNVIRSTLTHPTVSAIWSTITFFVGLIILLAGCFWGDCPAYIVILLVTCLFCYYTYLDYSLQQPKKA